MVEKQIFVFFNNCPFLMDSRDDIFLRFTRLSFKVLSKVFFIAEEKSGYLGLRP